MVRLIKENLPISRNVSIHTIADGSDYSNLLYCKTIY